MISLLLAISIASAPPQDPQRIAFTVMHSSRPAEEKADLYVCDLNGKHVNRIATGVTEPTMVLEGVTNAPSSSDAVSWSPDGKSLYFIKSDGDRSAIYLMKNNESAPTKINSGVPYQVPMGWINNTQLEVYRAESTDSIIDAATGKVVSKVADENPGSPNGHFHFVDHNYKTSDGEDTGQDLVDDVTHASTPISHSEYGPLTTWSPDSKYLAVNADYQLYVIRTSDLNKKKLDASTSDDLMWSSDGRYLAWRSTLHSASAIAIFDTRSNRISITAAPEGELSGWTKNADYILVSDRHDDATPCNVYMVRRTDGKSHVILRRRNIRSVRISGYQRFITSFVTE